MPVAPDGVLEATYDPAWAAVRLIVDGGMWPEPVDTVTITRQVAGSPDVPVRGAVDRQVVGGTFVGTDHEQPIETPVTYRVDGYAGGEFVHASTVTVQTDGAEWGVWVKVPGQPDMTVRVELAAVGEAASQTLGGVYNIAGGGGAVPQSPAQWSGIEAERIGLTLRTTSPSMTARLRAALAKSRVLLLQTGEPFDFDSGWYYVDTVARGLTVQTQGDPWRHFVVELVRTRMPAGTGAGIAGRTWAGLMEDHATWADVLAAYPSWFDVLKG